MNEDKYIELINKEISGTISARERAALHEYLRNEPGVWKLYDELLETSRLLGEVNDVEPPQYLKKRIMDSLDFSRYEARQRRPVMEFLMRARQLSLKPRFAYAFALGIAVGLVVYSVFLTTPAGRYGPGVRDMYGTIGITEESRFAPVERVPINLPQAKGWVNLLRVGDVLKFEVYLPGPHQYEILLKYDSAHMRFGGLRPGRHGETILETGAGYVKALGPGDARFDLSFLKQTALAVPVDLALLDSGDTLDSHTFVIAPDDEGQSGEAKMGRNGK